MIRHSTPAIPPPLHAKADLIHDNTAAGREVDGRSARGCAGSTGHELAPFAIRVHIASFLRLPLILMVWRVADSTSLFSLRYPRLSANPISGLSPCQHARWYRVSNAKPPPICSQHEITQPRLRCHAHGTG